MTINRIDIAAICGYIIGVGGLITPDLASRILTPFGLSQDAATHVVGIVGALVLLATLIMRTLKTPSAPDGLHSVLSPDPTPTSSSVLTTHADPAINAIAAQSAQNGPTTP